MHKLSLIFVAILVMFVFQKCRFNHDLKKIVSTKPYFENQKQVIDTSKLSDYPAIISNVQRKDSLAGIYHFIVWPGYHGHTLILNADFTFSEVMWTDYMKEPTVKGRWSIRNNILILKKNGKHFSFIIYKYSWTVFLIPENKIKEFTVQFEKNKAEIDSLSGIASNGYLFDKRLNALKWLCFYRLEKK